jgi:hypothetical protein
MPSLITDLPLATVMVPLWRSSGKIRNAYILIGNPEQKRSLERPRRKFKDNIKLNLKVLCQDVKGSNFSRQGTVAGYCERGNEI